MWALERVEKLLEKDGKPYRVSQCFPLLSLLRLFRTGFHQPFTRFIFTKTWSSALRSCHKLPYWASDWYSSCPEINERMGFKIYKAPALEVTSSRGVVMFRKSGGNGATWGNHMNCWWTSSGCVIIQTLRCLHQWAHPPSQGSATGMKEKLGGGRKTSLEGQGNMFCFMGSQLGSEKKHTHAEHCRTFHCHFTGQNCRSPRLKPNKGKLHEPGYSRLQNGCGPLESVEADIHEFWFSVLHTARNHCAELPSGNQT